MLCVPGPSPPAHTGSHQFIFTPEDEDHFADKTFLFLANQPQQNNLHSMHELDTQNIYKFYITNFYYARKFGDIKINGVFSLSHHQFPFDRHFSCRVTVQNVFGVIDIPPPPGPRTDKDPEPVPHPHPQNPPPPLPQNRGFITWTSLSS